MALFENNGCLKNWIILCVFGWVSYFVMTKSGLISDTSSTYVPEYMKQEKLDNELNLKCEEIENKVYLAISKGDKNKALELLINLNHPSKESSEHHFKEGDRVSYNEYWNKKKVELRFEINKMVESKPFSETKTNQIKTVNSSKKTNSKNKLKSDVAEKKHILDIPNNDQSTLREEKKSEPIAVIDYSYFERYLGIYSIQYDNGNTRMFKFSMNSSNSNLNILYQDNISGNSKIEIYKLLNFDQSTGRIVLESKNNSNEKTRLYLKTDSESKNGYKLVDENSVEYTFLLKD
jgi:hypothetical protein